MADLPDLPPDALARIRAAETAAAAILRIYRAEGANSVAEARFYYQQGRIDAAERVFDARANEYLKAVDRKSVV